MNETTLAIPWEPLEPGPVGEYIAVVDEDEAGNRVHDPVDLDRPEILAQNGLPPSDGDPQFRQQMVYAVAMHTIRNFERALGRAVHWAPRFTLTGRKEPRWVYDKRLELYPHYLQQANAYYSMEKHGLMFGYFSSQPKSPFPGTTVFSCLSQDVISHELMHALLMGMRIDLRVGDHPDVAAFHEAFSDIVALLQHFSPSDVLRHQIASIRGRLDERSSLGAVALQFGQAIGKVDGLRNALGFTGADKHWHPRVPDPKVYSRSSRAIKKCHDRGDVLVGAVFEAFKKIYESRVTDLRRIASKGTGILPQGTLHPDLVNRFRARGIAVGTTVARTLSARTRLYSAG